MRKERDKEKVGDELTHPHVRTPTHRTAITHLTHTRTRTQLLKHTQTEALAHMHSMIVMEIVRVGLHTTVEGKENISKSNLKFSLKKALRYSIT